jgi:hypothetical protein
MLRDLHRAKIESRVVDPAERGLVVPWPRHIDRAELALARGVVETLVNQARRWRELAHLQMAIRRC